MSKSNSLISVVDNAERQVHSINLLGWATK